MHHVLISGGTPIFQTGLARILEGCLPDRSITFSASRNGSNPPLNHDCDLWIMVIGKRPGTREYEAMTRQLSSGRPLLLGGHVSLRLFKRLVKLGLGGYLLTSGLPENLCEAIGVVMSGRQYVDPDLRSAWLTRQLEQRTANRHDPLTKRERQVLKLIVLEYTTDEIATQLFISPYTVETHRAHLLQKLGVRNTAGIVREAMQQELCAL